MRLEITKNETKTEVKWTKYSFSIHIFTNEDEKTHKKNEGKQKCNIKLNIFLAPLNLMNCALKEYMVIKKKKKKRRKL